MINNSVHVILFNLNIIQRKRDIGERVLKSYSGIQILTATIRTLYVHVILN